MDFGEGGIRTHVPVTRQHAFEARPLRPLRYLSVEGHQLEQTFHYTKEPSALRHQPSPLDALLPKERLHQVAALGFAHARHHLEPMSVARQLAAEDRRDD